MLRIKAYSLELIPNGACERAFRCFAGCRGFIFNRGLALQKELYKASAKHHSYAQLCELLTCWKQDPELNWLNDTPSQMLQQALKDLGAAYAYKQCFNREAAHPKFKKKSLDASFRYSQGFKVDQGNARLFLPKLGWVRYRKARLITGTPKNRL